MRPPWSRLALRSLVRGGPAWPCFDCGGLITSDQERQTFNSVPFRSISFRSLSCTRGLAWSFTLILTFSPQGRRDLTAFHGNDVCEQCSNQQGYGVSSSCRWFCIALPNPLLDRLLVPAALVHCWCMARTNIDIDDQACAEVMRRYRLATKREAINFALRTLAAEPASLDEARALRGIGWEGDLDALRQMAQAQAPTLADLMLAIPQDDGDFDRLPLQP